MEKWIVLGVVVILVILTVFKVLLEKLLEHFIQNAGIVSVVLIALLAVTLGVTEEIGYGYIGDYLRPILFSSAPEEPSEPAAPSVETSGTQIQPDAPGPDKQPPETEPADYVEASSDLTPEPPPETPAPDPEPVPETPAPDPEPDPLSLLEDITGQTSVSGSVVEKGQINQYRYTAPVNGTYCFDSGLDYGVVSLQIDNAYGGKLSKGSSSMSTGLEAEKTYILSVEYGSRPSDYTIQIGVPNPVTDITGQTAVSGSLTYLTQNDCYTYTAPVSGTYWFDAVDLNFNALFLEIRNAQGGKIASGSPSTAVALEAGKVYTLCVKATIRLLDYTIQIHVPNPPMDVTALSAATGTLTYPNQRDQYYYTPSADGSYCFDTGKRYGGVSMAVRDTSGASCGIAANVLTASLKAGTQYVLEVYQEYVTLPVEYSVSIAMQQEP